MIRRWSIHATVIAAVLLGAVGCGSDDPAPRHRDLYAYGSDHELIVADGTTVLSRTPGQFTSADELRFSRDGKYVVRNEFPGNNDPAGIVAVNVAEPTEVRRLQCGCAEVFPTQLGTIAWQAPDGSIMRADLTAPNPEPTVWRTLPVAFPPEGVRYDFRLLSTDGDRLLFVRTEFRFYDHSYHHELFTIEPDGTTRSLGGIPAGTERFIDAAFSPDGTSIAVSGDAPAPGRNPYRCRRTTLTLVTIGSAGMKTTIPDFENCTTPTKIRWDNPTGASVTIRQRAETEDLTAGQSIRWLSRGGLWFPSGDATVDTTSTATGTELEVDQPTDTLYRTANGTRTELATDITAVAVPQSESP
ncbi:hypothetical protein ACQPZ2_08445 [Nocardia pseudovaccinii]|uniref:hypothetical protein n=1 Tax=Nocardia pseudovaccinii TaxID=189540 RepID=UPI003D8A49ED